MDHIKIASEAYAHLLKFRALQLELKNTIKEINYFYSKLSKEEQANSDIIKSKELQMAKVVEMLSEMESFIGVASKVCAKHLKK